MWGISQAIINMGRRFHEITLYCMKTASSYLVFLLLGCSWPLLAQFAIGLDRMNALYPGMDNPITVAVSDVPDSNLLLLPSMGEIYRQGPGQYNWRICHRDTTFATLTILDTIGRQEIGIYNYRVIRPPIPAPQLFPRPSSATMPNGEFKAQGGIAMVFENSSLDYKAEIVSYLVMYFSRRSDPRVVYNFGGRFNSDIQDMIHRAKPGDRYVFSKFSYRIGCDPMVRYSTETLVFEIK